MSQIISALKSSEKFIAGGAAKEAEIDDAEKTLDLVFAPEYKEYLKEFGFASYKGHELTGICKSARLNVVDVTQETRRQYSINSDMYVVEDTGYDGIMIIQNKKGEIYQIQPHGMPEKIANSLTDYIKR